MKAHIVTLPGDYIGPEIVAQAVKVLNAVAEKYGHTFCFDERRLGGASIDAFGVPLSSVDVPVYRMGRIAAEQLLAVREGAPEEEQHHIVLGAELHARASSLSQN